MRTGAPAGHQGYFHEAAFYNTDEEFLAIAIPFLEQGVAAGEPAVVGVGGGTAELLRAALTGIPGVVFLDDREGRRTRPANTIATNRQFLADRLTDGAQQIRVLGEVPHPGLGAPWDWWARYEATINHAFAPFPAWGLCPYDTRLISDDVAADVVRTHPHLATVDGRHVPNPRYQEPADFLAQRPAGDVDPLEATTPPVVDLLDPTPAAARNAARAVGDATVLDEIEVDDTVLAVSEAVTNALAHGRPPVRLRLWSAPERVVASISDAGPGPSDPFAGLLPTRGTTSAGLGLWMIHRVCTHVTMGTTDRGFTIRLVMRSGTTEEDGHVRQPA
ncbi:anti-sigma factor RsbA family regulatory protein [Pseudonocardia xinjiangensis]|uniref:anti-sigma factor RsbA family regulatory protein n=1 Tax=Pseudonocardia xinjiangensis TaxID=75289 RepID=UPI003D8C1FD6